MIFEEAEITERWVEYNMDDLYYYDLEELPDNENNDGCSILRAEVETAIKGLK